MGLYQFGERVRLSEILRLLSDDNSRYIYNIRVIKGLLEWNDPADAGLIIEAVRPYATLCSLGSYRELAQELVGKLEALITESGQ